MFSVIDIPEEKAKTRYFCTTCIEKNNSYASQDTSVKVPNFLLEVTGPLSQVTESCFRGEVLMLWGRWVFSSLLLASSCSCSLLKEDTNLDSALQMDEA